MIIEILGLNMTALNSLIRASAILAKLTIFAVLAPVLFWVFLWIGAKTARCEINTRPRKLIPRRSPSHTVSAGQ